MTVASLSAYLFLMAAILSMVAWAAFNISPDTTNEYYLAIGFGFLAVILAVSMTMVGLQARREERTQSAPLPVPSAPPAVEEPKPGG